MAVENLPTAAEVTSGTQTNAEQKVDLTSLLNFLLGKLGRVFGQGPQTVASAATLDLEAVTDTRDLVISGTTAITAVTIEAGKVFRCRASGAFTLTNNANIITQRGADIVAAPGDTFMLRATAANTVEVLCYTRASITSMIRLQGANGYGSTNTCIRRFNTLVESLGTDITYVDSATLGATFTINTAGAYAISHASCTQGSSNDYGISKNSSQLSLGPTAITAATLLVGGTTGAANLGDAIATTVYLAAGDVIRAHGDATPFGTPTRQNAFTITRVG